MTKAKKENTAASAFQATRHEVDLFAKVAEVKHVTEAAHFGKLHIVS